MAENKISHLKSISINNLRDFKDKTKTVSAAFSTGNNGYLSDLSKINLFVGPNNSGKSRLLRSIFVSEGIVGDLAGYDKKMLFAQIGEIEQYFSKLKTRTFSSRVDNVKNNLNSFKKILEAGTIHNNRPISLAQTYTQPRRLDFKDLENAVGTHTASDILEKLNPLFVQFEEELEALTSELDLPYPETNIYIPTLRSLRKFEDKEVFYSKTKQEYFSEHDVSPDLISAQKLKIFDGTRIYEDLTRRLLTSSEDRKKVIRYEEFLSSLFFKNQEIQLSPNIEDGAIHIKIGNDKDIPIYDLGDGMQAIITITYPAYFMPEPCRIHVEEPELFLHPGMQRRLMEVISHDPLLNRHQWFMTTHSNHMLDLTLEFKDISIYRFQKNDTTFNIEQLSSPTLILLNDLGINASSVFRSNSIVWVEGITDRLYIKCFLEIYCTSQKHSLVPREDIDFSIVEYGGNNVTHFNFTHLDHREKTNIRYIAQKSLVIFDGDNMSKKPRKTLIDSIHPSCRFVLRKKEIENILPPEIIAKAAIQILNKSRNANKAMMLEKLECEDSIAVIKKALSKKPIGQILDEISGGNYFATESGTIRDKLNFCNIAISLMCECQSPLTKDALKLSEAVYKHVKPLSEHS